MFRISQPGNLHGTSLLKRQVNIMIHEADERHAESRICHCKLVIDAFSCIFSFRPVVCELYEFGKLTAQNLAGEA